MGRLVWDNCCGTVAITMSQLLWVGRCESVAVGVDWLLGLSFEDPRENFHRANFPPPLPTYFNL